MKKINIIGGGISGLASALYLRSAGYDVSVFDRRQKLGGVANQYTEKGFTFDTGPTWYLMPDVFEKFFSHFGIKPGIDFKLMELDPSYRIYYDGRSRYDIRKNPQKNRIAEIILWTFSTHFEPTIMAWMILGGFTGSVIDSFLGATVQVAYRENTSGKITEKAGRGNFHSRHSLVKGIPFVDNDMVNFMSISFAGILMGGVFFFLYG